MAWLVPLKQKSEKAKLEARTRAGAFGSAFIDNDDAGVVRLSREHSSNPHPCQEPVLHWLIIPICTSEVATESCSELVSAGPRVTTTPGTVTDAAISQS